MLLSKAINLTDTVTASVTSHLPGPLAGPVQLAVSTLTWVPRQVVKVGHHEGEAPTAEREPSSQDATVTPDPTPTATGHEPEPHEPEVVLTLDRPAEDVEPPIDVVGEALRAETPQQPSPLEDEGHVEVAEEIVYSTSSEDS